MKRLIAALLLTALLSGPSSADILVLKGGQRFEGDLTDRGKTYEIKVGENVVSINKTDIARHILSIEALTAEAEKLHAQARELYAHATKPETELKEANDELKKGVELLRKAVDLYQEARDVYPEEKHTVLDMASVKLLQEMRLYRDKMGSEIARSIAPSTPAPEPKAEPEAKAPTPETPTPKAPAPPAKPVKPDLLQLLPLAKAGDVEAMYGAGCIIEVEDWKATEAVTWLRAAADKGHARAMVRLGLLALEGRGRRPDLKETLGWLNKADAKNEPLAKVYLARMQFDGVTGPRNVHRADELCERAVVSLRKDALAGDPEALRALGWMHLEGLGIYQSNEKALEFFRNAAALGDVRALVQLGEMYDKGHGVAANRAEAVKAYRAAAEKGFAPGEVAYAEIHDDNFWRQKNPGLNHKLAREWFQKAMVQGNPAGTFWFAWFNFLGTEGPKDEKEGMRLLVDSLKTADQKYRSIILNDLGLCSTDGRGVPKNRKEAAKYFREASDMGNSMAQYNLGEYYLVDMKSESEAFKWFEMSAKQNFAMSTCVMGDYYREGRVVPRNLQEAERWYAVAVQLKFKEAEARLKAVQQERAAGKR
jgi:TPR repeat protein